MSIYKMRTEFGKHFKWILGFIALIFVVGAVYQFGTAPPSREREGGAEGSLIAEVGGMPIEVSDYQPVWQQVEDNARNSGVRSTMQLAAARAEVLKQLVENCYLLIAATQLKVDVSDDAIEEQLEQMVTEHLKENRRRLLGELSREQELIDPRDDPKYIRALEEIGSSLSKREQIAEQVIPRTQLRAQVAQIGIAKAVNGQVRRVTNKDIADSYNVYKVRQILIASGKLPPDQARNRAQRILTEARAGKDFAKLARENSDDFLKEQGGATEYSFDRFAQPIDFVAQRVAYQSLQRGGQVDQKQLAKAVAAVKGDPVALLGAMRQMGGFAGSIVESGRLLSAAERLKPGRVSGIIAADSGHYIIKLESIEPKVVKLDKKATAERRKMIRQVKALLNWVELDSQVRQRSTVTVRDPEMAGYWHQGLAQQEMMRGNQQGYRKQLGLAASSFKKALALRRNDPYSAIMYVRVIQDQGDVKGAANRLYQTLEKGAIPVQGADLRIWLADLLVRVGGEQNKKLAVEQLAKASDAAVADRFIHEQLVAKFRELGRPGLAAAEEAIIAEIERKMKEQQERTSKRTRSTPAPKPAKPSTGDE